MTTTNGGGDISHNGINGINGIYTRRLLYRLSFYERLIGISFGPLSDERISVGVRVCERDRERQLIILKRIWKCK